MNTAEPISLVVCVNPIQGPRKQCCGGLGSEGLAAALENGIDARAINARVDRVLCLNNCYRGPVIRIGAGGRFFFNTAPGDVPQILDALEVAAGRRAVDGSDMVYPGG